MKQFYYARDLDGQPKASPQRVRNAGVPSIAKQSGIGKLVFYEADAVDALYGRDFRAAGVPVYPENVLREFSPSPPVPFSRQRLEQLRRDGQVDHIRIKAPGKSRGVIFYKKIGQNSISEICEQRGVSAGLTAWLEDA